MVNNTINVSRCDNELILIAYQWGQSFQIGRILSGNNNAVDVTIEIQAGEYTAGIFANGVNNPISTGTNYVNLQPGEYTLVAVGIDWGGPAQFDLTLNGNGEGMSYGPESEGDGVVWNSEPIKFSVEEKQPQS
ncbi:MAG: hypothetical protein ACJA0U_000205 [Salibacteraceae bacterium]|jgi:hypothetical protein